MKFTLSLNLALLLTGVCATSPAADRPNIVWLISEDNSIHYLKLFHEHGADTPRIAELAEQGLIYEHAFSNAPVCSVARTTLITGCYGPRIGTQYHRKHVIVPMPTGLRMFPAYLRDAGYYTANNQKKDYNAIEGDGVWDISSRKATWRNRASGQPFFYVQSFGTTHESSLHFSRQEMEAEPTRTDPDSVHISPYHPDTPTFRYTYARYHDRIQQMDQQIGSVVDQLKADGLLEDTFIFYFGDHGGVLPRGKGYAYESGLHVPLVVRIPANWQHLVDAQPGTRRQEFVSFVDFGPTVLHLAGIQVPREMDGRPFLGTGVTSQDVQQRKTAFGYADRFDEKYDLVRTLRKGRFKYIRSYQPFNFDGLQNNYRYRMLAYQEWRDLFAAGQLNAAQRQFFEPRPAEMLFDVQADPHEVQNLANDPESRSVLLELRSELSQWVKQLPDLSLYPESVLASEAFTNPVEFGLSHQQQISELVDIADLALRPFSEAKYELEQSLAAEDPWKRYWGLIVCSCFGSSATVFETQARVISKNDPEPLVRVRAAEFLALTGNGDPSDVFLQALRDSRSGIEAGLILNSLTLLQDGQAGCQFPHFRTLLSAEALKNDTVQRRLEYLDP